MIALLEKEKEQTEKINKNLQLIVSA